MGIRYHWGGGNSTSIYRVHDAEGGKIGRGGGEGGRRVGNSTEPPLLLQNLDDIATLDVVVEC